MWRRKAAWGKPLEGLVQSAPRAELAAVLAFAEGTEGDAKLGVDCAYVVDGFANKAHLSKADGPNMDLWGALGRRLAERRGELNVYKVKGVHKDDEKDLLAVLEGKIPMGEFIGTLRRTSAPGRSRLRPSCLKKSALKSRKPEP